MSRFLRICAFLVASLISTNLFAADTSCKVDYFMTDIESLADALLQGTSSTAPWTNVINENSVCGECAIAPNNPVGCPGGTDAPVYKLIYSRQTIGLVSASAGYCGQTSYLGCYAGSHDVTSQYNVSSLVPSGRAGSILNGFTNGSGAMILDGNGNVVDTTAYKSTNRDVTLYPSWGTCPAGYYCSGATPTSKTTCPAGSYCAEGSSAPTTCPAGSYCPEGSAEATTCPAGSYCPEGSAAATTCPSGWDTGAGATSKSQCHKDFVLAFNNTTFAANAWSSLGIPDNPEYVQVMQFNGAGTAAQIRVFYTENAKFVLPDTRTEPSTKKLTGGIGTASTCTTPYTSLTDISGAKQAFNIFSLANSQAPDSTLYLCAVTQTSTACREHKMIMIRSNGNELVHPSYTASGNRGKLYMKPGDYKLYTNVGCTTQYTGDTTLFADTFNNVAVADTSETYPNGFRVAGYYLGVTPENSGAYSTTQPINSDYLTGKYTTDRGLADTAYMSVPAMKRNFLVNSDGTAASTVAAMATTGDNGITNIYAWTIANPLYPEYTTLEQVVDISGQITGKTGAQTGIWQYTTTCPSGYSLVGVQGTYNATCEPSKFFITYDGNGATGGTAPTSPTECLLSEACPAPTISYEKTGYRSAAWSCFNNGTGSTSRVSVGMRLSGLISKPNQTLTCTPLWDPITYTVHFDANGGTGTLGDQTMIYGTPSRLYSNVFRRTGYTFAGWGTRAADTTATYTNSQSVSNLSDTNGDTVTLYAVWTPNETGRITLEDRDGILQGDQFIASPMDPDTVPVSPGSIKIKYNTSWHNYNTGTRIQKLTTNPSIPGFTFGGFYTNTQCQGEQMINENGNFVSATLTKYPTAGTTATWYACWKGDPYTVLFASNAPSNATTTVVGTMPEQTMYRNTYAQLTANAYELPGYTFNGWNTYADGSGTAFADKQSVNGLAPSNINSVILYAQWTPNTITIDWDENGGDPIANSTCTFDDTFQLPTTTRQGYIQNGWKMADGTTWPLSAARCTYNATGVYSGTTDQIQLQWREKAITVVFDSNKPATSSSAMSGSMADQTFQPGVAQALRSNGFSMRGYNFAGWSLTPVDDFLDAEKAYDDQQIVTNPGDIEDGTVTLYAIWEPQIMTITINKNGGSGTLKMGPISAEGTDSLTRSCAYDSEFFVTNLPAWDGTNNALTKENMVFTGWSETENIKCTANKTIDAVWETPTCDVDATMATATLASVTNNAPVCTCTSLDGYYCPATQTGTAGETAVTVQVDAAQNGFYALAGFMLPEACPQGTYSNKSSAATGCTPCAGGKTTADAGTGFGQCPETCPNKDDNVKSWTAPKWSAETNTVSGICTIYKCNDGYSVSNNACVPNTINVVFNANKPENTSGEVTGTMTDQSFTYGVAQTLSANAFSLPGYTFQGWATTADGTVVYENEQSVTNPADSTGDTANLYAVWHANTFSVRFDGNGANGTMAIQGLYYDQPTALVANAFNKTGYTFAGWALTKDGPAVYADKEAVSNLTTVNGETVTLYAVWSAGDYKCAAGTYLPANKTTCTSCPAGNYCIGGTYTFNATDDQGISGVCASGYSTGGASTASCTACTFGSATLPGESNHDAANDCQLQMGLNKNGGSGIIVVDGTTYDGTTLGFVVCHQGEECVLPDASKLNQDGYDFTGRWGSNPSCTDGVTSVTYTTNAEVVSRTHYACKTPTKYSITYNLNGGEQAANSVTEYDITQTVTLPTPTHNYASFVGWFETSDLSGTAVSQTFSGETGNKVLYAKWNCAAGYQGASCTPIVTGAIKLDSRQFSAPGIPAPMNPDAVNAAPTPIYIKYNSGWYTNTNATSTSSLNKLTTLPSIPGYTFGGFYTDYNCGGTQVIDTKGAFSQSSLTMYDTAGTTATWYACWQGNTINVTFDYNRPANASTLVSGTMADQTFTYNSSQALNENAYSLPGYTFNGWNTAADGSGTAFADKAATSKLGITSGNITLYAQWTPNTITIDWDENGGEAVDNTTCTFDNLIRLPDATRTGYQFTGWQLASGVIPQSDVISCNYVTTGVYSGTSSNIKAIWNAHPYTVTFKSGNTVLGTQNFTYGLSQNLNGIAGMSNIPVESVRGWKFKGWAKKINTTDVDFEDTAMVNNLSETENGNVVLYAIWERDVEFTYYDGATATTPTTTTQKQYYRNTTATAAVTTSLTTYALAANQYYGWEPLGWALGNSGSTTVAVQATTNTTSVAPSAAANAHYYALYSRNVEVNYVGNGNTSGSHSATTGTQYFNAGSANAKALSITLPASLFGRTGYTFKNWALGSPTGAQYSGGDTFDYPNSTWTSKFTYPVYATWTPKTTTVTFKSGDTVLGTQDLIYDNTDSLKDISTMSNIPVSAEHGWRFVEWTTMNDTDKYTNGANVINLSAGTPVTLFAVWERDVPFTYYTDANGTTVTTRYLKQQYRNTTSTVAGVTSVSAPTLITSTNGWQPYAWVINDETSAPVSKTLADAATEYIVTPAYNKQAAYYAVYGRTPTIVYDGNGATSGTMANETAETEYINSGDTLGTAVSHKLAANKYAKSGYEFKGWTYGSQSFENEAQASFGRRKWASDQEITLLANWGDGNFVLTLSPGADATREGTQTLYTTYSQGVYLDSARSHAMTTNANPITVPETKYTISFVSNTTETIESQTINKPFNGYSCIVESGSAPKICISSTGYINQSGLTAAKNMSSNSTWNASWGATPSIVLPIPSDKPGYTFEGWYADSTLKTKIGDAGVSYTPTANDIAAYGNGTELTLYGSWSTNTYSVRFDGNGATGTMASQAFYYDQAMALLANMFSRTGYTFTGWALTKDGPAVYADKEVVSNLTTDDNANIILYAVWTPITYTVAFNANGGSGTIPNQVFTYDVTQELTDNTSISRSGKQFIGWATTPTGEKAYDNKAAVKNLTSQANNVVTLYAVWGDCPSGYYCPGDQVATLRCPLPEEGWTIAETSGMSSIVHCAQTTNATDANSTIAKICTSGKLQKNATDSGTWGSPRVVEPLKAASGYFVNGTTCATCASKDSNYSKSAANNSGGASACYTTCGAGQYVATQYGSCTEVGVGYYAPGGNVNYGDISGRTRQQCPEGLTTIGYGVGANEAEDCGRKLHAGDTVIYLRSGKRTTPSLNVKVGDQTFYGVLSTTVATKGLKVKDNNGTTYSVVDDFE